MDDWIKFPRSDFMKNFKKKRAEQGKYPSPDVCILEMVNAQLKVRRVALQNFRCPINGTQIGSFLPFICTLQILESCILNM